MMHMPMTVQMLMRHGAAIHSDSLVSTFDGRDLKRASFAEVAARAEKLAASLSALGIRQGDRVATFCWNHQPHLEAYLAAPSMGAILHTLNIRLFPEQIAFIMAHAEDKALIIDAGLVPLVRDILPTVKSLRHVIVIGPLDTPVAGFEALDYEALIAAPSDPFDWPEIDDTAAAVACYTSGTTGHPKGVVYSHRSTFVHSMASLGVDTFGICQADRILLLPSMFHANAWGIPFSAWLAGSDLIMPGPHLQAPFIRQLVAAERPTFTALVPTLINDLLRAHEAEPLDMSSFRTIVSGGSAVSPALIEKVRKTWGVPVLQGWGMTETSPLCTLSIPPRDAPLQDEARWRAKSGRPVPGMEVRLINGEGRAVPHNGKDVGELQLRGPWVTGSYYNDLAADKFTADGWLRTGDVGAIDGKGYVQITDRVKDVIKSGGEWVSSVDLENQLLEHEDIFEAAVIAVPDPRWEERPLAVVTLNPNAGVTALELRHFLNGRVARLWIPEYWSFVSHIPKTSVGKIDKKELRRLHAEGALTVQHVKEK